MIATRRKPKGMSPKQRDYGQGEKIIMGKRSMQKFKQAAPKNPFDGMRPISPEETYPKWAKPTMVRSNRRKTSKRTV